MRIINYVNSKVRSWFAICDRWISIHFFVFQGSLLLNVNVCRVFLKSAVSFTFIALSFLSSYILKYGKFQVFLWSFQIQVKHRYGRVKMNRYIATNKFFVSFCSLLLLLLVITLDAMVTVRWMLQKNPKS